MPEGIAPEHNGAPYRDDDGKHHIDDDGGIEDGEYDGVDEGYASNYTKRLSTSLRARLFDVGRTREQVMDGTAEMLPAIKNPMIAALAEAIRHEANSKERGTMPAAVYQPGSTTWPSCGVEEDASWNHDMKNEPLLTHVPSCLNPGKEMLVKPRGTFDAPMLLVSS